MHRSSVLRLVASILIGVTTGLVVLALEHSVDDILHEILEAPAWVPAVTIIVGAIATAALVHYIGGGSSSTTDVYVEEFHRDESDLESKHVPGRLLAALTTLGSGAPLGMEGPAVYSGTAIAAVVHRKWRALGPDAYHALMVAGAAAGIAAVFKAPAAGAIFALEVPFRGRLAGERVLPAIFGSAAGYLTMASLDGVKPELEVPLIELSYGRVAFSLLLGVVVGVAAIGVIRLIGAAEHSAHRWPLWGRAVGAGIVLAAFYLIGREVADAPLALTSGNSVIDWAVDGDHALWVLVVVFLLRAAGPAVSIAGAGVGGLFIPLMAAGAVLGRLFAEASNTQELALYVVVGAACMLGAGYAVPLTGIVFVAEYTGQATVIVPALIAMTAATLVVGDRSVCPAQQR